MVTRKKNKSVHPGIPDMTPSQRASAGLSRAQGVRSSNKKPTKDQQISALNGEVQELRELIMSLRSDKHAALSEDTQVLPDTGGDTDPATDIEEPTAAGMKRKAARPAGSTQKLKRSRAMDPFESSSMAHSGATGLVDDWRTRITPPYGTPSPQPLLPKFETPGRNIPSQSSMSTMSMTSMSTPSPLNFGERPSPQTYQLPSIIKGSKRYPGIKNLPLHLRHNFRNEFIRFVIRELANSQSPWINPDVQSLQAAYEVVYPAFPGRLRHSDAVCHPTITSLGVLRNQIAAAAVIAIQRYLPSVFRKKRLQTIEARAEYIMRLFQSDDHPMIWRTYVEGNIQNHPEVGGYKTTRRGAFQSDPILETLLSYYSSYGVMEPVPTEDPGPGNRPLGVLALVATAVERAYKMYATGDFIESGQPFNAENWGPRTAQYMSCIIEDLGERQWGSLFGMLSAFSRQIIREEAACNGIPEEPSGRVPLPHSDPPSSPRDD